MCSAQPKGDRLVDEFDEAELDPVDWIVAAFPEASSTVTSRQLRDLLATS